jgi:hypothetical protein
VPDTNCAGGLRGDAVNTVALGAAADGMAGDLDARRDADPGNGCSNRIAALPRAGFAGQEDGIGRGPMPGVRRTPGTGAGGAWAEGARLPHPVPLDRERPGDSFERGVPAGDGGARGRRRGPAAVPANLAQAGNGQNRHGAGRVVGGVGGTDRLRRSPARAHSSQRYRASRARGPPGWSGSSRSN